MLRACFAGLAAAALLVSAAPAAGQIHSNPQTDTGGLAPVTSPAPHSTAPRTKHHAKHTKRRHHAHKLAVQPKPASDEAKPDAQH